MNQKQKKTRNSPMMEMMSSMMGEMKKSKMGGMNSMMGRCAEMMENMNKTSENESYSTDELMDLFKDWCSHVEDEIVDFIKESGTIDEGEIAEKFNLSKESVTHLLKNLKKAGKV